MLDHLNSRVFAENLNTTFRIIPPGGQSVPLQLFEVSEKDASPSVEQFSLIFRGPLTPVCNQGIYPVEHDKLGKFDLFFVPLGPESGSMNYQVVFCRMRKPAR